jgi:hypothetical protein
MWYGEQLYNSWMAAATTSQAMKHWVTLTLNVMLISVWLMQGSLAAHMVGNAIGHTNAPA